LRRPGFFGSVICPAAQPRIGLRPDNKPLDGAGRSRCDSVSLITAKLATVTGSSLNNGTGRTYALAPGCATNIGHRSYGQVTMDTAVVIGAISAGVAAIALLLSLRQIGSVIQNLGCLPVIDS